MSESYARYLSRSKVPTKELKETTQVRLIKSEARSAILEEREAILGGVKELIDTLKDEMHRHFATKSDLIEWKLENYKENEARLKVHIHNDHKASIMPRGRVSLIPRGRLTTSQKGAILAGIGALLSAIAAAVTHYFGTR